MSLENLIKDQENIDSSVEWIENKTEQIYSSYEKIEDCYTQECEKEKEGLQNELNFYINKLKLEEKNIDSAEEKLYALSGSNNERSL
tara:strand:- start:1342 stop:1602 length:261 start_codon:yes stop_codon:yes gene_type:complete